MVKLIALYKKPEDTIAFEKHYFGIHLPLVSKIPGLLKTEISLISSLPGLDSDYFLQAEMYYEDIDKLNEGMASPEGKAAARDLMSFAKDYVVMMIGEIKG
jgi:uncharacterized protein (TIGR02118 family)